MLAFTVHVHAQNAIGELSPDASVCVFKEPGRGNRLRRAAWVIYAGVVLTRVLSSQVHVVTSLV